MDAGGKVAWTLATGIPSGLGTSSDNQFYLPLREAGAGKEPEVCVIDVPRGEIVSHTKSRKKALPGNLIFHDGEMVSQTSTAIAVYPQLSAKLAQIDDLIRKNPADPVGLTERGDLRLDKGDWAGAVSDLATALRNKPPAEILERTREKLFDAMCEFARRDFARAEAYLTEFKSVCDVPPAPSATPAQIEDARKESRRRKSAYLCLFAAGRESQGKLAEAFDAYLEVASVLGGGELQAVLEEPSLRAASDTWAQGRVSAMVAKANKGDGVATLAKAFGVSLEEVAVLGDQANDLPMLTRAGLPIVMANAPDAVREQISVHTRSNADDGVAYAIDTIILPRIGVPS